MAWRRVGQGAAFGLATADSVAIGRTEWALRTVGIESDPEKPRGQERFAPLSIGGQI